MNDHGARQRVDKIRVLLVDDKPTGLPQHLDWRQRRGGPPQMDVDYCEWFDFRWVATPQEACEFRDLSWLISQQNVRLLEHEGWVPEVVPIDYALTQDTRTVADRVNGDPEWFSRLSPLPSLRECARRVLGASASAQKVFTVQPRAGNEYWGCFIGGLLMSTFADHPCVPVTITRYTQQTLREKSPDAKFFEEFMELQTSGLLRATGTESSPSWQDIIPRGMKHLRHRLEVLGKASIITLSFSDLVSLAGNADHEVLRVDSRFGQRRLPVNGLFIDKPSETPRQWATRVLAQATGNGPGVREGDYAATLNDWQAAEELSDIIWAAYLNGPLVHRRRRLSEALIAAPDARPLDFEALCRAFDVKERVTSTEDKRTSKWEIGKGATQCRDIRYGTYTALQRRWAALRIIIRLFHHRWLAKETWRAFAVKDYLWESAADALLLPIESEDIYLALHPVASMPAVLPWHSGKTLTSALPTVARLSSKSMEAKKTRKRRSPTTNDTESDTTSHWGDLGLSIDDVLAGLDWTDDPANPTGSGYHGMRPGERIIMSWYANTLYGSEKVWINEDTEIKRILRPQMERTHDST